MGFHFLGKSTTTGGNWHPSGDAECANLDSHSTVRAMMTSVNIFVEERRGEKRRGKKGAIVSWPSARNAHT